MKYCSLSSGSSGNCQYIESNGLRLLVDAGLSGKKIQNALQSIEVDPKSIDGIFVTHEHIDHVKGVGILSRRFDLPIYANEGTWYGMKKIIGNVKDEHIKFIKNDQSLSISDMKIMPFGIYHDANAPVGYTFESNGKKISLLTDTGMVCDYIKNIVRDADLTLIECNHDIDMLRTGAYPWHLKKRVMSDLGHLSNEACGEFIKEVYNGEEQIYLLGHLSNENNIPTLAYDTVKDIVDLDNKSALNIHLTHREMPTELYNL